MTNAEVEDILSSIRRLVSEDARNDAPKPDPEAKPADRLVLTPSFRIKKPVLEEQVDGFELLQPEPSPQADANASSRADEHTAETGPAADVETTLEVSDGLAEAELDTDAEDVPEGLSETEPDTEATYADSSATEADAGSGPEEKTKSAVEPTDDATGGDTIGWSVAAEGRARLISDGPDRHRAQFLFRPSAPEPEVSIEAEIAQSDEPVDLGDHLASSDRLGRDADDPLLQALVEDAMVEDLIADIVTEEDEIAESDAWVEELAEEEDPFEDDAEDADLDTEEAVAAAPFIHVELSDDPANDRDDQLFSQDAAGDSSEPNVVTLATAGIGAPNEQVASQEPAETTQPVPSLGDKIAALETLIARGEDEFEPDVVGEGDSAPTEEPMVQWDDVEAQVADVDDPDVLDPEPLELEASDVVASAVVGDDLEDVTEEGVLDEAALRELVSDIVREELQGALGERITRNVRKLVRREIQRALSAHDLD